MGNKLIYKTKIDVSKHEGLQEFLDTYYPGIEVIDDDVMTQYGDWLLSKRAITEAMEAMRMYFSPSCREE